MKKENFKLSPKKEKFCREYLIDLNGTKAATRAGYSPKTANEQASRLLANVNISDYINSLRQKDAENAGITRAMVLEGYRKLAFYDSRKFYDAEGNLLSVPDLDEIESFALSGFEVDEIKNAGFSVGYTKKIKMSDRRAALDSLCKVLGYNLPEKTETELILTWQENKTYKNK